MKTAFLFPGQGAQKVGMAMDFVERCGSARALFDRAGRTLGCDLPAICRDGPQETLNRTDICQPALLVAGLAALEYFRTKHDLSTLDCAAAAGLSLGEYTALVFNGAMTLDEALPLVRNRGRYMQEACDAAESGMASVIGLARARVDEACEAAAAVGIVGIANLNAPDQIVIAGETKALAEAGEKCKALGARRVIPLKVAGAYHSPLMKPAQDKLRGDLAGVAIRHPSVPVAANVSAKLLSDPEEIREALAVQVVSSVRWEECMRTMISAGIRRFIEFGPGGVLTGLARKIDPSVQAVKIETVAEADAFVSMG